MTDRTFVFQTAQIRQLEYLAQNQFGLTSQELMQRAGKAACDLILQRWPQTKKIVIYSGNGNNGGDGYAVGCFAAQKGVDVTIIQVGDHTRVKSETENQMAICKRAGLKILPFNQSTIIDADIVVDALLGIGLKGDVRDDFVLAINQIQSLQKPIVSLDIPSGVDADTGQILGSAVHAQITLTFIALKLGLLTGNGVAYTGDLFTADLGVPHEIFEHVQPVAEEIELNAFSSALQKRFKDWHKGLSGHVLIIGGELGYSGAPRMAAEAALRVGAGLVTVATRPENSTVMNVDCPEIMCLGIKRAYELQPLMNKADVIILGPGLGQTDWSQNVWKEALKFAGPMVVDADGLNLLARSNKNKNNWVLTPHPGEAARLLSTDAAHIQSDRLHKCCEINQKFGGVCVLKGAGTMVCVENNLPALCNKGNPGMATAGMGDVLSGVIGGLIAQRIELFEASKLGVLIHAMAGDLAAKNGERGMIATDLMPFLKQLVNV